MVLRQVLAGFSLDLVMEQVLMHSLYTRGGIARPRGMSEVQRLTGFSKNSLDIFCD